MATFRYTLRTPDAAVKFGTESVRNWQDVKPSIVRNETYRGVFQTMSSTLEFVGVARDIIIRAIDAHGYDVPLYLTVEVGNNNRERSSFEVFEGMEEMKADNSGIDIQELYVSLNFVESGFVSDLINREDVKVNIDVTETIDGDTMPAYSDILETLYMHDRKLVFNSLLETADNSKTYDGAAVIKDYFPPLTITYRSDDNFKSIIEQEPGVAFPSDALAAFYLDSEQARSLDVKLKMTATLSAGAGDIVYGWKIRVWRKRGGSWSTFVNFKESVYLGGTEPNLSTNSIDINIDYFGTWDIEPGDSFALSLTTANIPGTGATSRDITFDIDTLSIEGTSLESFADTLARCIRPHELFERLIHITTGQPNAFYSEYFGRVDLGYEQDGQGCNLAILNGLMIRNFPDGETKLNTSFKEAFEAFSKEFNLVGTIQTINNKKVFRIEPYADIYKQSVVLKLGAVSEVSRSIDFEKIFTEINVGGRDQEYEEVNGLYSFNGQFNFATPMNITASVLNLISPYRKDDIGIELTRRQQYSLDPGKDYRADQDIFIIDAFFSENIPSPMPFPVPFPGGLLVSTRAENYEDVQGIFQPSRAYNLNLSPGRQLRHWGGIITAGLLQKIDKNLKFTKGAKNQDLITTKVGESEIIEAADIQIQILDKPIVLADNIMIAEAAITFDEYKLLAQNNTELVEFVNKGVQIFGYIKSAEFDFERNICNFEIERANY